ncbi:MAG: SDR family oxidoreductase [Pseudomonadota bacterium]
MSQDSTALITGASAGIGRHLAAEFARHGHDLVLVARRRDALESLADEMRDAHGVAVSVMPADLAPDGAADALADALADRPIDILVNNAGVLSSGMFRRMDAAAIDNMLRVNLAALTTLCHRFAQPMVEQGSGRILNIASIAAFQPVPTLAVYAATKAYVLSLSESLSVELADTGVTVTAVCPGFTDTTMLRGSVDGSGEKSRIPEATVLSPEQVARDAYKACLSGDAVKVPGLGYALTMATSRLLPRWVLREAGKLALKSGKRKR